MRGKGTNGVVMVLSLLLVATSANGIPTMNDHAGDAVGCVLSSSAYANPYHGSEISYNIGLSNSRLGSIAAEFHKPAARFAGSPARGGGVKAMPPVPGTLPMVLVGFLCVSLVRDRRVWLAALAGLLWAGRMGFSFLPQLALQLAGKSQSERQSSSLYVGRLYEPKHPCRLRSDVEGTYYIGLLRHLAGIPDGGMPLSFSVFLAALLAKRTFVAEGVRRTSNLNRPPAWPLSLGQTERGSRAPQSAIARLSSFLIYAANCLAPRTRQRVYFAAAFIIADSARGPPNSVRIANLLSVQGQYARLSELQELM